MTKRLRFSICNEVFEKTPFQKACRQIRQIGYEGIEIAPFTLATEPQSITQEQRREFRDIIEQEGLQFVGLHWLMISPPGLHVTTADVKLRTRSWNHIRHLIDLCADLGENGVMVFGSPKQRNTTEGMTGAEAAEIFTTELARVAPQAEQRSVRILVEALPSDQSDVINTLREAVAIVDRIGSPAVGTMFDTHNAADETEPHHELVRRYFAHIAHVHVNEMDGREPGTGNYDFAALFSTLEALSYEGWVSLEVFDFSRPSETIAANALEYLKRQLPESTGRGAQAPVGI